MSRTKSLNCMMSISRLMGRFCSFSDTDDTQRHWPRSTHFHRQSTQLHYRSGNRRFHTASRRGIYSRFQMGRCINTHQRGIPVNIRFWCSSGHLNLINNQRCIRNTSILPCSFCNCQRCTGCTWSSNSSRILRHKCSNKCCNQFNIKCS